MTAIPRRGAPTPSSVVGLAADRYEAVDPAERPDLVVVHGAMDRAAGFRRTIRHLPHREVVAYDRRGYGGSVALAPAADVASSASDLVAVLADLHAVDGRRRLVVGHSMGGVIALAALGRPGIEDLAVGAVVWEPPMAREPWYRSRGDDLVDLEPADAAESFLRGVLGDRLWERLPAAMRAERRVEGAALVADLRSARDLAAAPALDAGLGRIGLPLLVGYGGASSEHHRRSAVSAAAAVGQGPAIEIDGADHGIHLSRPSAFAAFIASWGSGGESAE